MIKKMLKKILKKIFAKLNIKNFIILESRPDFSDNTKRIYDYLIENNYNDKYIIVWLTFDEKNSKVNKFKNIKNVKCIYFKNTIKKYFYCSQAKFYINCNRDLEKLNPKTVSINLWHGTLLKNLKDIKVINEKNIDYCLCPSEFYIDIYEEQLHVPKNKLIVLNNPRNDYLFSSKCSLNKFFNDAYKRFIIWMPTFRQTNNGNRIDSNYSFNKGIPVIQTEEDIKKLNDTLKLNETLLVIKPHFAQDMSIFKISQLSNIKIVYSDELIEKDIELYEFLGKFDALITDYSSVYFDFLVTNRPIAFTIDDIDEYSKGKGFIFENPQEFMPGKKIENIQKMLEFIEEVNWGKDNYKEERERINKIVNTYIDNKNAERVCEFLKI